MLFSKRTATRKYVDAAGERVSSGGELWSLRNRLQQETEAVWQHGRVGSAGI
tara:strand:+ start:147 stop:302 length:156 start_codon:yes stop_codon:yes gene_type:complete